MVLREPREAKEEGRVLMSLLERSRVWSLWKRPWWKHVSSTVSMELS